MVGSVRTRSHCLQRFLPSSLCYLIKMLHRLSVLLPLSLFNPWSRNLLAVISLNPNPTWTPFIINAPRTSYFLRRTLRKTPVSSFDFVLMVITKLHGHLLPSRSIHLNREPSRPSLRQFKLNLCVFFLLPLLGATLLSLISFSMYLVITLRYADLLLRIFVAMTAIGMPLPLLFAPLRGIMVCSSTIQKSPIGRVLFPLKSLGASCWLCS